MHLGLGYETHFPVFQHHVMEMLGDTMPKNFKTIYSRFTSMPEVYEYLRENCEIQQPTVEKLPTMKVYDSRPKWDGMQTDLVQHNLMYEDAPLFISNMFDDT